MELLNCENLSVRYGSKTIFADLNFRVCSGDYLCIIGDNGAGKSTLMKTILGLHKEYSGKIDFHENFFGKGIGYLPQQNAIQKDFPASVWEVVFSGFQKSCGFRPFYTKAEKQNLQDRVFDVINELDEKNGDSFPCKKMLQGTFWRTAAAGFAVKGIVCY